MSDPNDLLENVFGHIEDRMLSDYGMDLSEPEDAHMQDAHLIDHEGWSDD